MNKQNQTEMLALLETVKNKLKWIFFLQQKKKNKKKKFWKKEYFYFGFLDKITILNS